MPRPSLLHHLTRLSFQITAIILCVKIFPILPVSAVAQCDRTDLEFKGPQFALPITKDTNTCDVYDETSAMFDDFINRAHVICVSDADLIGNFIGEGDNAEIIRKGDGTALLGLDKNTNFAIDPKILDSDALGGGKVNEQIYSLKKPISMSNNLNPADFTSECLAKGYDNPNQCAKALGVTIPTSTGDKINILQASTPYQRLTSLKDQLKDSFARAQEHIACKANGAGNTQHCGNQYDIGGGTMSTSLANNIKNTLSPNPDLTEYFALSPKTRQQMLSLEPVKSSQRYYLYIEKSLDPSQNPSWLDQLFFNLSGDSKPILISGFLPAVPAIAAAAETEYRRWNTLETGNQQVAELNKGTGPVKGNDVMSKIQSKVHLLDKNCNFTFKTDQLMGSNATSREDAAALISWVFNFSNHTPEEAQKEKMVVYKAWIVGPKETELIAAYYGRDSQSPSRADYPITYTNSFAVDNGVGIPQPINSKDPTATTDRPTPPPTPSSIKPSTRAIQWTSNANANQKGGEFAHFVDNETKQKAYQSVKDPEYFVENCYYPQIQSRAISRGIDLSAVLGIDSLGLKNQDSTKCPAALTPSNTSSFGGDICAVAKKYNVPCEYLKAIWYIETNQATSCSDAGPDGPMQIVDGDIPYIDPNQTLDRCKLTDAWELAARTLLWKMYGSGFNPSNPTNTAGIKLSLDPSSRELQTTAQYNGTNGCQPNLVTQCRWGVGRSYCDAVVSIIQTGTFTWDCDVNMCKQFRCSQEGPEIMCQGQSITRENCGN